MIYDIYVAHDDCDYKDVHLDMALEDYSGAVYRAQLVLTKRGGTIALNPDIMFSPSNEVEFDIAAPNEVPAWVKHLRNHLLSRMHEVMETGRKVSEFTMKGW